VKCVQVKNELAAFHFQAKFGNDFGTLEAENAHRAIGYARDMSAINNLAILVSEPGEIAVEIG